MGEKIASTVYIKNFRFLRQTLVTIDHDPYNKVDEDKAGVCGALIVRAGEIKFGGFFGGIS